MTENSRAVFDYLKKNYGNEITTKQLSINLNVPHIAVVGAVRSFATKGFVTIRDEQLPPLIRGDPPRIEHYVTMTELGHDIDLDAEELRLKREHLSELATRKEKRRQEKLERAKRNSVL